MSFEGLAPELVWGLIPRFIGLLFVLAFGAVIPQHHRIPGSARMLPMRVQLERVRRDYPGVRRFFMYPTVLWLNDSDAMVRGLQFAGVLLGLGGIYGGVVGWVCIALAHVFWVSLELRGFLFPWDTLLQEVSFLSLFLPLTEPLPSLHASALPLPSVAFMFRWLIVRLMLGFGKDEFVGSTKSDALYLRGFFVWMPLPGPLGWLAHHAPRWFLRAALYFMFYVELVAPVLAMFTGPARLIGYVSLVLLMLGIAATGSWGYFNIGYILLCTCFLDVEASLFDLGAAPWASRLTHGPDLAVHGVMLVLFLLSLVYFPTNSWFSRAWPHYPVDLFAVPRKSRKLVSALHRLVAPARWLAPFRIVNGYGVFPPNSLAPMRMQPVLEGSADGVSWQQYGYKHIPSFASSPAPYIAPYHARLDQWTYYTTLGIDTGSLFGGVLPSGNPYTAATRFNFFDVIMQRIMRGDRSILAGLGHNPFPDSPPKYMRLGMIALTPTSLAERRATGNWWHVRRIGLLTPARALSEAPEQLFIPEPQLFLPEFVAAKRRALPMQRITQAFEAGMSADQAAIAGSDLSAQDVEQFWQEVIPFIAAERGDWSKIHERAAAVAARYDVYDLHRFERLLERFAWLLMLRTEPHHWGDAQPELAPMSRYRFHKLLHEVILDGRAAYQAVLEEPALLVERANASSDATQLWALGMLRYDHLMTFVLIARTQPIVQSGHMWGIPGFFEYYLTIRDIVPPGEEFRPLPVIHDNGEHTVEGFYPPRRWAGDQGGDGEMGQRSPQRV